MSGRITGRSGGRSLERVTEELGSTCGAGFCISNSRIPRGSLDSGRVDPPSSESPATQTVEAGAGPFVLSALGLPAWAGAEGSAHARRWWWVAGLGAMQTALPGSYFERLGVPRLRSVTPTR